MRKALFTLMCLAAMLSAGTSLKAQEVTITLTPGWTWMSSPTTEAVDFTTAMGDFTPMQGDVIKSQWGQATYINGQWRGGISQFYPGYGYHYKSNRTDPVIVTFNTQSSSQVVVTTATPTNITATSVVVGGMVMLPEGSHVFLRGVCWGTEPNPDIDGSHTTDGTGIGSFSGTLEGLNPSTTYYVCAYAVSDVGLAYGNVTSFTTLGGIPEVTTAAVTNVTGDGATCGGTVVDGGGLEVTARGVCWSTASNPTIADAHSTDGTGTGSFGSTLTGLTPNTTYYVRAYATNSYVTVYGNQRSFTTESGGTGGDHAYVDLGLPSGLLWATCNVGADNPEDYGDYFAWGETTPKDTYKWSTYQYCNGSSNTLTKYCSNSSYGYNGFTDNLTTLLPEDDAATANWGNGWRMPTQAEFQELLDNTTVTWTTQNGVDGRLFTASNGNSLFLPAAGYRRSSILHYAGILGYYWSSSLYTYDPYGAWRLGFDSGGYGMYYDDRFWGRSVRPVRSASQK